MASIVKMGVNYTGKFVLAPMVRIGELPTRLVALKYGADLVWGPEIIDKKIITFQRVENKDLNTIDFISTKENHNINKKKTESNGPIVSFRTHRPSEHGKLIFQMGTANADLAVQAANIIIDDVDGIDINAGCPKHFSIHAGMGAALLSTPDLLCDILTRLVNEVGIPKNKPISVKIRLLENKEKTLELVDRLLKTGISNLSLHCRTREMRNRQNPIRDYLPFIIPKCREKNVSFIINGGITCRKEYLELQKQYGDDIGAMVAEAAEANPSVFAESPAHWAVVAKDLVYFADRFQNHVGNTKYCLGRIVPGKAKVYQKLSQSKTQAQLNAVMENLAEDGLLQDSKSTKEQCDITINVKSQKRSLENDVPKASSDDNSSKKIKLNVDSNTVSQTV